MGTDGHGYIVFHAEFPSAIKNPDAELDQFEVIDRRTEKRLSETPLKLEGAVGRRYVVEVLMGGPGPSVVSALVAIRGSKIYVATANSASGAENSPEVQRFLESFALVP